MLHAKPRTVRKRRYIEASRLFDMPWLLAPAALRSLVLSHQAAITRSEDNLYDDEDQEDAEYDAGGRGKLTQLMSEFLLPSASKSDDIYDFLVQWPFAVYLTTNYDDEINKRLETAWS